MTKNDLGRFKEGNIPWNKNKSHPTIKGNKNPAKRYEVREKLRLAHLNKKIHSKESKRKIGIAHKGKSLSKEHKLKISISERKNLPKTIFKKGNIPHNFNNYSSFEPYGKQFNNKLKEEIRKRDHYRCQECFRHQTELRTKTGKSYKLLIHHIDYNKQNNNDNNLISLCRSCHLQTNFSRNDWQNYLKERLEGES